MIFTHIFRYLDDKDAEELRRSSTDNSSSPGINSRFQDSVSSWEHRDVRFKQISVKAPLMDSAVGRVLHTPRKDALATNYTSLRAGSARCSSRPRALPPIRRSQITGEEKQLTVNDKNSAKLPPIEPFASQGEHRAKEKRSRSRRNKEAVLKSDACVQDLRQDHEDLKISHKKVMAEENNAEVDRLTDHLQIEEKGTGQKTASFHDMSVARDGVKKDYYKSFPQTAKQHDFETRTELGSNINNTITADASCMRSCSVSEQCSGKIEWDRTQEHTKTKIEDDDFYKCVGLNQLDKTELPSVSAKQDQENVKLSDTVGNTQNTENLHMKWKQTVLQGDGFLATANNCKKICHVEFVACERGRRNAICEVLEKRTEPRFGSSLYEMRQNLIQLS